MLHDDFYCAEQVSRDVRLHDVSAGAGLERRVDHLGGIVLAENEDFRAGHFFPDQPRSFESVKVWHADVEHDDIRIELLRSINGVLAIHSFAAYYEGRISF